MKMRVESIAGRLDFNERRARALEAVVQYKPEAQGRGQGGRAFGAEGASRGERGRGFAAEGQGPSAIDPLTGGESLRSRRRRRRRGRRSGPGFAGEGRPEEGRGTKDEGRETKDEGPETKDEGPETRDEERAAGDELERPVQGDEQEPRAAADAHGPDEPASERASEANTPTPSPGSDPDQS
jgi:hypothetical protein